MKLGAEIALAMCVKICIRIHNTVYCTVSIAGVCAQVLHSTASDSVCKDPRLRVHLYTASLVHVARICACVYWVWCVYRRTSRLSV